MNQAAGFVLAGEFDLLLSPNHVETG